MLTLTSFFLLERENHGNLLHVILLSVFSTVLLYKPFRVTGALQVRSGVNPLQRASTEVFKMKIHEREPG